MLPARCASCRPRYPTVCEGQSKYSDWFLLILLSALAFWILGRPLVGQQYPPPAPAAPIRSTRQTYNTWIFEAQTDREVHLVWRNRYFRGWTASVRSLGEGAREAAAAPVAPAFGGLMAARIPAGHPEVTFRFAPP